MLTKQLKKSGTAGELLINALGHVLTTNDYHVIDSSDEPKWLVDQQTKDAITNGDVIVNDGQNDLNAEDGLKHFLMFAEASNIAVGTNYTEVFATSTQEALEKVTLAGKGTALELKNKDIQDRVGTEYSEELFADITGIDTGLSSGYVFDSANSLLKVDSSGTMTMVSTSISLSDIPLKAILVKEDMLVDGGTASYFISIDDGASWTTVSTFNELIAIVSNSGTQARIKCTMTGEGSCFKGYGLHFEVELI